MTSYRQLVLLVTCCALLAVIFGANVLMGGTVRRLPLLDKNASSLRHPSIDVSDPPYTIEQFIPERVTCGTVFPEDEDAVRESIRVKRRLNETNILTRVKERSLAGWEGRVGRGFGIRRSMETDALVKERYWEEPSEEMKRFMAKWRVAMAPTAKEFQQKRYLTDNATWRVHKLDPLRNKVPDCSKVRGRGPGGRFTLVAVGDSHVRDFGEQMCLQLGVNSSRCESLGKTRSTINDFVYGNVQTHFRWHTTQNELDMDTLMNVSSADMVMYSANAWYTTTSASTSWQALRRFTADKLRELHERFPCAMFAVVPDWHRHFMPWKRTIIKRIPIFERSKYLAHRYRCIYSALRQKLSRRAFLCGVLDFQRNRTNLVPTCPHASRIPMYDEVAVLDYFNFSYHVPLADISDHAGHHWYGHYGEAMTMNMIRELLCPVKGHSLTRSMKCYADTLDCDSLSHAPEKNCKSYMIFN